MKCRMTVPTFFLCKTIIFPPKWMTRIMPSTILWSPTATEPYATSTILCWIWEVLLTYSCCTLKRRLLAATVVTLPSSPFSSRNFCFSRKLATFPDTEKPTNAHDLSCHTNDSPSRLEFHWGDVALGLIGVETLDMDEPLMDAGLVARLGGLSYRKDGFLTDLFYNRP